MPIFVTCSTCGHQYQLSSRLAGKALRCKLCQGVIQCPPKSSATDGDSVDVLALAGAAPAARRPAPQAAPAGNSYDYDSEPAAPRQAPPTSRYLQNAPPSLEPSKDRSLAARICFFITGLTVLGAILFTIATLLNPPPNMPRDARTVYMVVIVAVGFVIVAFASIYLICGILIRKGGHASVIIALVVASLHFLLLLAAVVLTALGALMAGINTTVAIQLCVQVLYTAAVGQLIHYLIKILRTPRQPSLA